VIKVNTVRGVTLLDIENTSELTARLRKVGATVIARRFTAEIARARLYMSGRLCSKIR
jgi:hypothetical protein